MRHHAIQRRGRPTGQRQVIPEMQRERWSSSSQRFFRRSPQRSPGCSPSMSTTAPDTAASARRAGRPGATATPAPFDSPLLKQMPVLGPARERTGEFHMGSRGSPGSHARARGRSTGLDRAYSHCGQPAVPGPGAAEAAPANRRDRRRSLRLAAAAHVVALAYERTAPKELKRVVRKHLTS
jgi:hypothetical protein